MGIKKRVAFDHSQDSVFEAAGYSEEIVTEELEPRAELLANQLVRAAVNYPLIAEVLLNSPILKDSNLDSRDRAVIVMMAGRFLASAFVQHMHEKHEPQDNSANMYTFHTPFGEEHYEALHMSELEWNLLVYQCEGRVFRNGQRKVSEVIEKMQEVLDDRELTPLQKAIIEALVLKDSGVETQKMPNYSSKVLFP